MEQDKQLLNEFITEIEQVILKYSKQDLKAGVIFKALLEVATSLACVKAIKTGELNFIAVDAQNIINGIIRNAYLSQAKPRKL